jgi:hypothetical protein
MSMADRKPPFDRDQSRYGGHAAPDEGDRYQGDTSGGYGTGGAAIDYHDVMGSGGYGARDYAGAYPDLDPDRVFARIDRGEAQSQRGRGPKGYQRSDARILEDVSERLMEDSHVDATDVEVTVHEREVTLAGRVASRDERRRAEAIADAVSGVVHVQNNLRVG